MNHTLGRAINPELISNSLVDVAEFTEYLSNHFAMVPGLLTGAEVAKEIKVWAKSHCDALLPDSYKFDDTCPHCHGSGQGQTEFSNCYMCNGSGIEVDD